MLELLFHTSESKKVYDKYDSSIILTCAATIKSVSQTRRYCYNITHIAHRVSLWPSGFMDNWGPQGSGLKPC